MKLVNKSGAGLIVLAIGGTLALNYPLLSLFDRDVSVFGIPLPFVYLFVVWTLLIGGVAILAERHVDNVIRKSVDDDGSTSASEHRASGSGTR